MKVGSSQQFKTISQRLAQNGKSFLMSHMVPTTGKLEMHLNKVDLSCCHSKKWSEKGGNIQTWNAKECKSFLQYKELEGNAAMST